jgi:hypothetical protein
MNVSQIPDENQPESATLVIGMHFQKCSSCENKVLDEDKKIGVFKIYFAPRYRKFAFEFSVPVPVCDDD